MTFEEMIDELQERFIFDIRSEPTLTGKLYAVWFREEIKQGRATKPLSLTDLYPNLYGRPVETNDQQ